MKIDGLSNLNKVLSKIPKRAKDAAGKQLKKDLLDLQGKAQLIAPTDTNDLVGSAQSDATGNSKGVGGYVSFDTPYATRQHEEMEYHHLPGKQAKYLEAPLKANIGRYTDNMGNAIKKAVGG